MAAFGFKSLQKSKRKQKKCRSTSRKQGLKRRWCRTLTFGRASGSSGTIDVSLSFDCTYKRVAPGAPPSVKRDHCWLLNLSPPSNPTASAGPSIRPSIRPWGRHLDRDTKCFAVLDWHSGGESSSVGYISAPLSFSEVLRRGLTVFFWEWWCSLLLLLRFSKRPFFKGTVLYIGVLVCVCVCVGCTCMHGEVKTSLKVDSLHWCQPTRHHHDN